MNYNVLFYSNQCDYCNTILKQLQQKKIPDSQLIRICVDKNRNIPSYITKVPTVISKNHKKPIVDEGVYMWINTLLSSSQQDQQSSRQFSHNIPQSNNPQINSSNEQNRSVNEQNNSSNEQINPYSPIEMTSSYSDSFSYLDNSDSSITHNFAFLDNSSGNNMQMGQQEQSGKPDQEDEYTKYMAARDADPEIRAPMRRI